MTTRNAATMGTHGTSWQHRGYSGNGNVKELLDSLYDHPAIVAGGAEGVFDEMSLVLMRYPSATIFAANEVGIYLPRVDHWATLHTHHIAVWKQARWLHPREGRAMVHIMEDQPYPFSEFCWTGLRPLFSLSGYFAMQIAWLMGCRPIILCGIPGDARRRFFDLRRRDDFSYGEGSSPGDQGVREQLDSEMKRLPEFRGVVKSMSGWTRSFFGGLK